MTNFFVRMIPVVLAAVLMIESTSAQPSSRIEFPVVFTSYDQLAQYGLAMLKNSSKPPPSFHYCYDYGAGGDLIAISHERLIRYRTGGYTLNSLCLGLISESKFDPETGERLPTFIVSTKGITQEHPLELPSCYQRALPFSDCTFNFDRLTGKRLTVDEKSKVREIGRGIDDAMVAAIKERAVCSWPFCAERWPKMESYWSEGSLAPGSGKPTGCFNLGYLPYFFRAEVAPKGINVPTEAQLRSLHASCFDISINLPAGYGYTTDADGTAGPSVSPELVALAAQPDHQASQIDPKVLAALLNSYPKGSNPQPSSR
jgi:hypothetical protein